MISSGNNRAAGGFTLIEILIAITIFAISVSIVYSLYGAVLTSVNRAEARISQNSRLQITLERFSDDLGGLYQGQNGFLVGKESGSVDEEPIIAYVSTSHLSFDPEAPPVPLAIIRYYLAQSDDDETLSLLRSDSPVMVGAEDEALEEKEKLVVCEGISEITINYVDRDGQEFSEWETVSGSREELEEQEELNRFPVLVTLELVFGKDENSSGSSYSTAVLVRPSLLDYGDGNDIR
jgi:general secretion pathway protein J